MLQKERFLSKVSKRSSQWIYLCNAILQAQKMIKVVTYIMCSNIDCINQTKGVVDSKENKRLAIKLARQEGWQIKGKNYTCPECLGLEYSKEFDNVFSLMERMKGVK